MLNMRAYHTCCPYARAQEKIAAKAIRDEAEAKYKNAVVDGRVEQVCSRSGGSSHVQASSCLPDPTQLPWVWAGDL